MGETQQLVSFVIDEQRYALYLSAVERIICAVEVTPLPKAPDIVLGLINLHGQIIPVFNIRKRFNLPEREIDLNDKLIIANTKRRIVGLPVDAVHSVLEYPEQDIIRPENILPGTEYLDGVVRLDNGMILIHNMDRFLSLEEEKTLCNAMNGVMA